MREDETSRGEGGELHGMGRDMVDLRWDSDGHNVEQWSGRILGPPHVSLG